MKSFSRSFPAACLLILSAMACANPQVAPTSTAVPPTLPPMVEPLQFRSTPLSETSEAPMYTIDAQVPYLGESTDLNVQALNAQLKAIVDEEITLFKQAVSEFPAEPILAGSS